MDFTLTDDQHLLRDTARNLLAKECPVALVRAHIDDRSAADPLWKHLAEWTELGDGPLVGLCLFLEETGAALAPGPFLVTTAMFAGLGIGPGPGTVALSPDVAPVMPFVLDADLVERVAFVLPGPVVAVCDRDGLYLRPVAALDPSRRLFEVPVPADTRGEPLDPAVLQAMLERTYVALAAEMLGTARRLFEMTLAYAKQREQFDHPIGSFQAIQHKLANMALVLERAWSAVYYAAMTIDAGDPERHRAAHVAKASAGEAAKLCAKDGIQIHGGIGFTWEHDLHLYIRRAYGDEHLLGTSAWHHDRLGDLLMPTAP
ncbi:MAG: acyl-CoA dehydrogenase [Actinobacteria bacterium]|nr:MAG: acyl-CoA dehydrogenase [Actinomycetota bacterium]